LLNDLSWNLLACYFRYEQQMAEEELEKLDNEEARKKRDEESEKYKANPMAQLEEDKVTAVAS